MKTFLIALLALFSVSAHALNGTMTVGSLTTNPAANSVLVITPAFSTGGTAGGHYTLSMMCSSNSAAATQYEFQVLNGSAVVQAAYNMFFSVPIGGLSQINFPPSFLVPDGYKFQIINPSSITGSVQCTIVTGLESIN